MDIVVKGRNVEVPDHFREHVADKLATAARLEPRVIRLDVELFHEKNPRQSAKCQRVEITVRSKGPVIRAEACAETFYAALDAAVLKLEARLRKAADRRRVHHGGKTPPSVAEATAGLPLDLPSTGVAVLDAEQDSTLDDTAELVVREKDPRGGADDDRGRAARDGARRARLLPVHRQGAGPPSVVYRRHGYDYGVIRLAAS